ncbi:transcriptional regulator [Flavobacterium sp. 316]|uniref:Crp/Fnr family transcriptional regulator n=1 Tax=Flavobacterium sediminilitoris TaxID=2024526 RepID=A0ABY4HQY7_9FLAO|nr:MULTISPECIES: Crp/Fnr family transcriptional regulator [Flavobacterium]KIX19704.1 transcriptional regulator [Flavobacterium sp. 316]UOX33924.1 Crp/Fnr family transcriptional regulator [Flavobacterium sediminilitoris]
MNSLWFFEDVNLFGILCPHNFKEYKKTHQFNDFNKNDYVYFEDDSADKIYLISSGKIKIGYVTEEGDEIILAILSRGEIFGEKAILGEDKRNEFAQAIEDNTTVCPITSDLMIELLRENREFSLKIYKFIGFRFKKLERRLQLLLFKDTKTRLKEYVKEMAEDFGYKNQVSGDIVIKHPYTQKEIAALIGTSRPTLNILLNELKEEEYLNFNRKEIILRSS